ncbi:unnamed protein product [Symbiodinium natans]|uniref:Protein kinase domain-containing protein n=1 Tax=Symbiodinium natans TaxID=878477 RepID=A0A812Q0F2_9DINO|nr:unnamed protein product [Symbiodinium natans]
MGTGRGRPAPWQRRFRIGVGVAAHASAEVWGSGCVEALPKGRRSCCCLLRPISLRTCGQPSDVSRKLVLARDGSGQHQQQWDKERAVGARLSDGPQHEGLGHVVTLLSSEPRFVEEDAEANSELMLVLEHAGQPLDSSPRLETLDVPSRCDVVDQLLSAVKLLRLNGIIHADISAGNCCLDDAGCARLVDFGNSLLVSSTRRAAACQPLEQFRARYVHHRRFPCCERYSYPLSIRRLVEEIEQPNAIDVYTSRYDVEAFPGNLAAMPPEILRGLIVPGASDVYGLGILLWWLLTGQETPFHVNVEVDRVSFPGWAHFYRSTADVQMEELRSSLARATPTMPEPFQSEVVRWLRSALAEAPEDRVWAASHPILGQVKESAIVKFCKSRARVLLSHASRKVLPPQLRSIYGEITAVGARRVARCLGRCPGRAVAELGSGAGRCALSLLQHMQASIVAVELMAARHEAAVLAAARCLEDWVRLDTKGGATWLRRNRSFRLVHGDILETWRDWCHVTAVFTSSLCFPDRVMSTLSRQFDECKLLQRVATLQMLPHAQTFSLEEVVYCPMSWKPAGSAVYIYERLPAYPLYRVLLEEPLASLARTTEDSSDPPGARKQSLI